eukprot:373999_1
MANNWNEDIIQQLGAFGYESRDEIVSAMRIANDPNDINSIVDYIENNRQILQLNLVQDAITRPVIIWRDKNIQNSYNSNILHGYKDVYVANTTLDAITFVETFRKQNRTTYIITNGGDNAQEFIRSIRYDLKISTEILIFCNAVDYVKTWAVDYGNVSVMKGKDNLRTWVDSKLTTDSTVDICDEKDVDGDENPKEDANGDNPVFIWRDRHIFDANSTSNSPRNVFGDYKDIHGVETTHDAIERIKTLQKQSRTVYIITNGGNNAEAFVKILRDKLNIQTEMVIFCNAVAYVKTWAVHYPDVTVMKGTDNLRPWIQRKIHDNKSKSKSDVKTSVSLRPVFIWRDKNINNSYNSKIFGNYSDVHLATTTTKAIESIQNCKQQNRIIYIITNAGDDAEDFVKTIRNDLCINREIVLFCDAIDFVRTWSVKYYNVNVIRGADNLRRWVFRKTSYYESNNNNAIQSDLKSILRNHLYASYFDLDRCGDDFSAIYAKLADCCDCIRDTFVVEKRQKSREALLEYLCQMYNRLFINFIDTQIKQHVNDALIYKQFEDVFNSMYDGVLEELNMQKDAAYLDITRGILRITSTNRNTLSLRNEDTIKAIKMKWYTTNDTTKTMNQPCNEPYQCISLQRIKYLLELFNVHFITIHKHECKQNDDVVNANKLIDFVLLYDECIADDTYTIIDMMNDFNHIHQHHIRHLIQYSYLLPVCKNKVCVVHKREAYAAQPRRSDYFGYTSNCDVHLIRLLVKNHVFLCHEQCLIQIAPNEEIVIQKSEENKPSKPKGSG